MNADQLRAYAQANWPQAMKSPLALAFASIAAADEADRTVQFASLQARVTGAEKRQMLADALEYAHQCLDTCDEHDHESISCHIESNFADLSLDECDEIAEKALAERAARDGRLT